MRPKCVENASPSRGIDTICTQSEQSLTLHRGLGEVETLAIYSRETSETQLNIRARRFHDESQVEEEAHEEIEEEAQKDETEI
ncbi:unnamed protein product [Brassica rapa]|uniref:Uncharacterized protein n=2 Tax=Brassica TaxID=3705 RepID=A0A8D9GKS4_BRACM|nr:unnamed protein product [Brassica napus]CAG7882448.1 unnamed protein product [Brassica rapa]